MSTKKRALLVLGLLGLGWAVGYAQRPEPEFLIEVDAPAGKTRIECVSGCELLGAKDLGNSQAGRFKVYEYGCGGPVGQRCRARVAGWLLK
jgi:hypothetical protein